MKHLKDSKEKLIGNTDKRYKDPHKDKPELLKTNNRY